MRDHGGVPPYDLQSHEERRVQQPSPSTPDGKPSADHSGRTDEDAAADDLPATGIGADTGGWGNQGFARTGQLRAAHPADPSAAVAGRVGPGGRAARWTDRSSAVGPTAAGLGGIVPWLVAGPRLAGAGSWRQSGSGGGRRLDACRDHRPCSRHLLAAIFRSREDRRVEFGPDGPLSIYHNDLHDRSVAEHGHLFDANRPPVENGSHDS